MRIGVNITTAASFNHSEAFRGTGDIDFRELLVDNFLHLEPSEVAAELGDMPVALHIMASNFLQRPETELREMAAVLHRWVETLEPLYVSDHLLVYEQDGQTLPEAAEADYGDADLVRLAGRWQGMLRCRLILENFASNSQAGHDQVEVFEQLQAREGVGVLFDYSNAIVAEQNGARPARDWLTSDVAFSACHISGYRSSELSADFIIDSHDRPVSEQSWRLLKDSLACGRQPTSLVVERDGELDGESWLLDVRRASRFRTR